MSSSELRRRAVRRPASQPQPGVATLGDVVRHAYVKNMALDTDKCPLGRAVVQSRFWRHLQHTFFQDQTKAVLLENMTVTEYEQYRHQRQSAARCPHTTLQVTTITGSQERSPPHTGSDRMVTRHADSSIAKPKMAPQISTPTETNINPKQTVRRRRASSEPVPVQFVHQTHFDEGSLSAKKLKAQHHSYPITDISQRPTNTVEHGSNGRVHGWRRRRSSGLLAHAGHANRRQSVQGQDARREMVQRLLTLSASQLQQKWAQHVRLMQMAQSMTMQADQSPQPLPHGQQQQQHTPQHQSPQAQLPPSHLQHEQRQQLMQALTQLVAAAQMKQAQAGPTPAATIPSAPIAQCPHDLSPTTSAEHSEDEETIAGMASVSITPRRRSSFLSSSLDLRSRNTSSNPAPHARRWSSAELTLDSCEPDYTHRRSKIPLNPRRMRMRRRSSNTIGVAASCGSLPVNAKPIIKPKPSTTLADVVRQAYIKNHKLAASSDAKPLSTKNQRLRAPTSNNPYLCRMVQQSRFWRQLQGIFFENPSECSLYEAMTVTEYEKHRNSKLQPTTMAPSTTATTTPRDTLPAHSKQSPSPNTAAKNIPVAEDTTDAMPTRISHLHTSPTWRAPRLARRHMATCHSIMKARTVNNQSQSYLPSSVQVYPQPKNVTVAPRSDDYSQPEACTHFAIQNHARVSVF
ncbi:uncharacterized protein MONBRDRAFT_4755 [Monosiga brevicollis MX1]|uniref:Uncharacterized protein n=1 Tax=Monosiga brevicollis TaxID=81824 RepID=A9UNU7_MONBE|nr:uncharacterized protein MONBRDRAFT_4755 [Monosiga brevicollis MX1]EDQ92762.1 predicted protein [Monosiga brevicollis MX1]|eukprot:XP_001742524.1 hypothetical protein [Monosiga brevicollis MX1]